MHLFISNSKNKNRVRLFILTVILSYIFLSVVIIVWTYHKHGVTTLDDKFTKIHWIYKNNVKLDEADGALVFVGSSRTRYNISTELFKKNNVTIYNIGMNGRFIGDYPWIISRISILHPKLIIIEISVDDLYRKPRLPTVPMPNDLMSFFWSRQSLSYLFESILVYIERINPIYSYSSVLYSKTKNFISGLSDCEILNKGTNVGVNDFNPKVWGSPFLSSINSQLDCKPNVSDYRFKIKNDKKFYEVDIACANGDGVLFGSNVDADKKWIDSIKVDEELNRNTLNLLNYMFNTMRKYGVKPMVLVMPTLHVRYKYNVGFVKANVNADIIDLSNVKIPDSMWVDEFHLNNFGRIYFSRILLEHLHLRLN